MIVTSKQTDFEDLFLIINDGASAYRGIIPADRRHEPYMTAEELREQIDEGVEFWIYKQDDEILGVMGIQYRNSVTLIRHAYVRTKDRNKGIGSQLLKHLCDLTANPILIGTWADAKWAIKFYQNHGFRLLSEDEKSKLLRKYWTIPERQIETSVVLASADWQVE
jgi:N-acetylglutamate synthase-like GNAT family acetyltransferase